MDKATFTITENPDGTFKVQGVNFNAADMVKAAQALYESALYVASDEGAAALGATPTGTVHTVNERTSPLRLDGALPVSFYILLAAFTNVNKFLDDIEPNHVTAH